MKLSLANAWEELERTRDCIEGEAFRDVIRRALFEKNSLLSYKLNITSFLLILLQDCLEKNENTHVFIVYQIHHPIERYQDAILIPFINNNKPRI